VAVKLALPPPVATILIPLFVSLKVALVPVIAAFAVIVPVVLVKAAVAFGI
jgi:hypothetical protein